MNVASLRAEAIRALQPKIANIQYIVDKIRCEVDRIQQMTTSFANAIIADVQESFPGTDGLPATPATQETAMRLRRLSPESIASSVEMFQDPMWRLHRLVRSLEELEQIPEWPAGVVLANGATGESDRRSDLMSPAVISHTMEPQDDMDAESRHDDTSYINNFEDTFDIQGGRYVTGDAIEWEIATIEHCEHADAEGSNALGNASGI